MNPIAINNTIQTVMANRRTTAKTVGSDFGIALQGAFSYSEVRGVNAIASNALEMLDDELEDMYVVSEAHKLQMPMAQARKMPVEEYNKKFEEIWWRGIEISKSGECVIVSLNAGEFPKFVEEIQNGVNNGDSLRDVLQKHYDDHSGIMQLGREENFYINPETGIVEYVDTKGRNVISDAQNDIDCLTSYAIADDIATLLRYTYFKEEKDDPVKIQALISGICQRSNGYNTERFNPIWDTSIEHTDEWYLMMIDKVNNEDTSACEDMIDLLLELLDRHFKAEQKRQAENDDFGSSSLTVAAMAAKIAVKKVSEVSTLTV
jgi:hypothetical protein